MNATEKQFSLFKKELRARRLVFGVLVGLMALSGVLMAFLPNPDPGLLDLLLLLSAAILGVTLFSAEEHDPARAILYQLPLSRARLLGIKLLALSVQFAVLLAIYGAFAAWVLSWRVPATSYDEALLYATLFALSSPLMVLIAAIVSLHARSVITALVLALPLGPILSALIFVPTLIAIKVSSSNSNPVDTTLALFHHGGIYWVALKYAIVTLMLGGWLFFLFCRTRLQELTPTPRILLALVFGVGAVEAVVTLFYTGWRDLAWLLFGL